MTADRWKLAGDGESAKNQDFFQDNNTSTI